MNNRQKQAEETKLILIKTAQKLITKYGYDKLRIEDITDACGRGKGTFIIILEVRKNYLK